MIYHIHCILIMISGHVDLFCSRSDMDKGERAKERMWGGWYQRLKNLGRSHIRWIEGTRLVYRICFLVQAWRWG